MSAERSDAQVRAQLGAARRIVIKVGSSSLTSADGGHLDPLRLQGVVDAAAARIAAGAQVVLVSSGAIAAGIGPLGLPSRPRDLATQQAAASVGQGALVAAYDAAFARHGRTVGQVLLTADDTTRRSHYTNAHRTLARLLDLGIVPIINENDTVATSEIRFGDNDRLAALVAHLIGADALVLLTDVDALYTDKPDRPGARRLPVVRYAHELDAVDTSATGSRVGTGGMQTKVEAATIANAAGITAVLAAANDVAAALAGEDVGTVFVPTSRRRPARSWWLAHATSSRGAIVVDAGAVAALTERGTSLLPAGVVEVRGTFADGDPVDVVGVDGTVVGRGLTSYSSLELPRVMGRSTRDLASDLGPDYEREVIHRDHLAVHPR
ncbi:glutamate 5-kinase [Marihabitans asiaticum]|uniref:Glutamate 5-kinase n=1 Tax=Marihabitans asiaticum TaxID=415218 RepID=A0A560W9W0_9MICO|nr:glutamate 5-kinase [Marihabitans asiaticum]TWD14417.1 glutamate 5-kinase [Marihabitans asiaticum]